MKYITVLFGSFALYLLCSCVINPASSSSVARTSFDKDAFPPISLKGECYAKSLIEDKSEITSQILAVYTGNEYTENVDVQTQEIVIQPAISTWVKKIKEGCVSNNPVDCEMACLVESPAITKEYKVLLDTTQSKNFEMQEVVQERRTEKEAVTVWTQVLCADQRTPKLIGDLQLLLSARKYYTGPITNNMDSKTQAALTKFQRENDLPIGNMDYESMKFLGIPTE